jgi:hypothetical protein
MSSADLKQQANAAISKQQQLSIKIGAVQSELNGLDSEDTLKISTMQNKIEGMKSNHAGLRGEATSLQNEARSETIKEAKVKFDESNKEQEAAQKEEIKNQQKIEKELAEKSKLSKEIKPQTDGKKESNDGLLFLNDDRAPVDIAEIVDFTIADPAQKQAGGAIDPIKSTGDDEKLIKGAAAAGS